VWAAAAVPMGVLARIAAPWLRDQLGGDEPLAQALLICITAGLVWQFVLVLILTRRELGGLQWPRVREALWLQRPRDPRTGRTGGRVWWWVLPFVSGVRRLWIGRSAARVDEQHCHRRLLLAVRSRRLGLIPGESSVSRKATLRGPAG
jgi:hypothetical protein